MNLKYEMDFRQMMSIFVLIAIIILMGQYGVMADMDDHSEPRSRSLNYNPNLQNLIMGPNEVDDDKGVAVKSKSVGVIRKSGGGILDTFSLSFVGNLNFSNAIQGVQKIVEGLASCELTLP